MYSSGTAIGGYFYALWFVDRRSKHIGKYPLKSLACRYMGGRYPNKMMGDRDLKLIESQVFIVDET